MLAFFTSKNTARPFLSRFMESLGSHVHTRETSSPFFEDVSRLAGITNYRLNEAHSAGLAWDNLC